MKYTSNYYAKLPRKDWGGALTGASSGFKLGASIGSVFGPIGSGVVGGIGALVGGIFGNRAEKRAKRRLKQLQIQNNMLAEKAKVETDRINKKNIYDADLTQLNTLELNNADSLYMKKGGWIQKATTSIKRRGTEGVCTGSKFGSSSCPPGSRRYNLAKTFKKMARNRADGGQVVGEGVSLGDGDKLLTYNGRTTGSHENGQNIPIKKKGRVVAVAEPGEVLVNDNDMPLTPFVLSKRIGRNGKSGISFAEEFMNLENMKNRYNTPIIESRQAELIRINNTMAPRSKKAANGLRINSVGAPLTYSKSFSSALPGIQKYSGTIGSIGGGDLSFGTKALTKIGQLAGNGNLDVLTGAIGTIGNIMMTNKALKRQGTLIQDSLKESLAYNPKYTKNYLFDETVDVSDQVGAVNQGYASSIAGLSTIDPAIASALKSNANLARMSSLNSIMGDARRTRIGLRNQNIAGIMSNNANNTNLENQTSLMKLNAKINANEQLGELESVRLANYQGAISELNNVLYNKQSMDSIKSRYKDTIKDTFIKRSGGRIGKKKMHLVY